MLAGAQSMSFEDFSKPALIKFAADTVLVYVLKAAKCSPKALVPPAHPALLSAVCETRHRRIWP